MIFAIKLYRIQSESGRFFLHEHPASASSWRLPEMISLMNDLKISKVNTHMCRFKMFSQDELGRGLVKKPTGFLTNSEHLRNQLDRKCLGSATNFGLGLVSSWSQFLVWTGHKFWFGIGILVVTNFGLGHGS